MIKIKNLTVKNFMSVGAQTQAVSFEKNNLTLVLGSNLDLGGDDSGNRNGTGKTTILNSLSYALYGQALTNIKKENLVNKINGKAMLVTVEFEKDGKTYRIERGRKPNVLKLFIDNKKLDAEENEDDEALGDSRDTQKYIDQLLEISHTMFKHIVALNTYTEPFLNLKASDQREVIEQLLGITQLSVKAESLKLLIKETKDNIQQEEFRINVIKDSNENIQKTIDSLRIKSSAWQSKNKKDVEAIALAIQELENVDIEKELELHAKLKIWNEATSQLSSLRKQQATLETAHSQAEKSCEKAKKEIEKLKDNKCPACEQNLQTHKHEEMLKNAEKNLSDSLTYLEKINKDLQTITTDVDNIGSLGRQPETFYESESEALNHKSNLNQLQKELENKLQDQNPYKDQIEELENSAIKEISWDTINNLTKLKDHQEFLLKLLVNKDSFVRKKIINQNLTYLNKRLSYYIDKLGLPHLVKFQNDLNVEITQLGQDLDFDNLSRGERNRLILSLSFAFRDVWEGLYQQINLLFIDELIDSGMDTAGVESALTVLKKMSRERNKNVYLISHKEELIGRVNNVLKVIKENGFTNYSTNSEYIERGD
jgi:DNA repair exonuclease SbcCD ATPase subunit